MDVNYPADICTLCSVKAVKPFKVFKGDSMQLNMKSHPTIINKIIITKILLKVDLHKNLKCLAVILCI